MSHVVSSTPPIASAHTVKQYAGFGILGADIPTTGENGGSPVLNDGINPTSEYHWRVETPPSDGDLTIYPDLSFYWDATGVPNGTYPWVYRLFEDGTSQGTATVNQVLGTTALVIAESAHAHTAGNLTLSVSGSVALVVQDALHGHSAEVLALTTQRLLTLADSLHGHTADNLTLDLSNAVWLTVQDTAHWHVVDNVGLTTNSLLLVADSWHAHLADSLVLDPGQRTLLIANAAHGHLADLVTLGLEGNSKGPRVHVHTKADRRFVSSSDSVIYVSATNQSRVTTKTIN